ncbi:putative transcriptional regulator [Klebsiella pneumoniae]|nr:putative transcriptional regulator [Klebsiella pneumoniae]VAX82098.1 putative transcriptional regulator [Klebsiella pneumoniae]
MTLRSILAASLLLLPLLATAHNFVDGQRVAPVGVADRGELRKVRISRSFLPKLTR